MSSVPARSPDTPIRAWLEYDTSSLLPWPCEGCYARVATYRLRGVMDGGPTYYCRPCGQRELARVLLESE